MGLCVVASSGFFRRSGGSHPGALHHGLLAGLARGGSGGSGLPGPRVPGPRADVVGFGVVWGQLPARLQRVVSSAGRRLRPAGHGRGLRRHRHLGVRPGGPLVPRGPAHRNLVFRPVHPHPGRGGPVAVPRRRGGRTHGAGHAAAGPAAVGDRSRGSVRSVLTARRGLPGHGVPGLGGPGVAPAVLAPRHGRGEPGDRPGDRGPVPRHRPVPLLVDQPGGNRAAVPDRPDPPRADHSSGPDGSAGLRRGHPVLLPGAQPARRQRPPDGRVHRGAPAGLLRQRAPGPPSPA